MISTKYLKAAILCGGEYNPSTGNFCFPRGGSYIPVKMEYWLHPELAEGDFCQGGPKSEEAKQESILFRGLWDNIILGIDNKELRVVVRIRSGILEKDSFEGKSLFAALRKIVMELV